MNTKGNKKLRKSDKKYIEKMVLLFVADLIVAALIVLGYYWINFRVSKTNSNTPTPIPIQISTAATTEAQMATETEMALVSTEDAGSENIAKESTTENSAEETAGEATEETKAPEPETEAPTEPPTEPPTEETTKDRSQMTWAEKFADKFTAEPVVTANSYSDSNISITVTTYTTDEPLQYYVADIYVTDIRYFGTGIYANDPSFGSQCSKETYARDNPLYKCFVNGDFCGYNTQGVIVRNGMLYRNNPSDVEQCVLYSDGTMRCYAPNEFTADMAVAYGAVQSWCFGPSLLTEDGGVKTSFNTGDYITRKHPRTALGYFEPGHYMLMVIDGRVNSSVGMTLAEMSQVVYNLGCKVAYNLDGGASSGMILNGSVVSKTDTRYVSDYVVVSATPLF